MVVIALILIAVFLLGYIFGYHASHRFAGFEPYLVINAVILTVIAGITAYASLRTNDITSEIQKLNDQNSKSEKEFRNKLSCLHKGIILVNALATRKSIDEIKRDYSRYFKEMWGHSDENLESGK